MDTMLVDAVQKFLGGVSPPAVVREVESTQQAAALWARIEASGFLDALVPEAAGGAGLGLRGAFPLWLATGHHALPAPLAQTMWLRAALAAGGAARPAGAMSIAPTCRRMPDGAWHCPGVPFGLLADWVLVAGDTATELWPVTAAERRATGVHGSLQAHLSWPARPAQALVLAPGFSWLHAGALLTAALMAGAMERVLEATLTYASERAQFGKSIGKFQAVQQQLAVMAEQVFAARMAAEIGCADDGIVPHADRAALAKARNGEAAEKVVAIAHAVHGAIGVTAEYDLQLHTRRLQEWRSDFGAPAYWHAQLGAALLSAPCRDTLTFLLARLRPTSAP